MPPFARPFEGTKNWFFDRQRVMDMMDRRRRQAMGRAGAFVRTRARSSIRTRRKVSEPGQPPTNRTGVLKKFIFFAYDPRTDSVVVGPTATNQIFFDARNGFRPVRGTGAHALEYGGAVTLLEWFRGGKWQRADLRSRRRLAERPTRYRTIYMRARPYMRPALARELPRFAPLFRPATAA